MGETTGSQRSFGEWLAQPQSIIALAASLKNLLPTSADAPLRPAAAEVHGCDGAPRSGV